VSEAETEQLRFWTQAAMDQAVYAGHIVPPWRPTEAMYNLMVSYYRAGLTPQEASDAAFATRH